MSRLLRFGRASGTPWWRKVRLMDVVVLSALPVGLAVYLVAAAVLQHMKDRKFDDWWAVAQSVDRSFRARASAALRTPLAVSREQRLDPEARDPGIINLLVKRDFWSAVTADPLAGFDQWIEADLDRGSSIDQVRLRKRGDNSIHWVTPKNSFTLRTSRTSFFKGYRTLGFSVKDVLPSYVANRLAREFDLLAPTTEVVPVYLNRRFYGLFRMVEVVDEGFLRTSDRMPGNIFRGDAAERGEIFRGLPRGMFVNPYIWDRVAFNDRPTAAGSDQLSLLVADVNGTTFEDHLRTMARVDRDEIARLVALMLVVGDPYHMDDVHNQYWYEDPSTSLLHPIPWDLRLLDLGSPRYTVNAFLRAALRDPFLIDVALREVEARTREGAVLRTATGLADSVYARYRDYFEFERLRGELIPNVGDPEKVRALLAGNVALLREWVADARVAYHAGPSAEGAAAPVILDLETRGYAGADLLALEIPGAASAPRLVADRNRNGVLDSSDPVVPAAWSAGAGRLTLLAPEPLLAGWDPSGPGIRPGTVHYRYFVAAAASGAAGRRPAVRPVLRNRYTGGEVRLLEWTAGAAVTPTLSWSPWDYPVRRPTSHRLAGAVHLRETLRIPAGDTLHIAPGTTIRLDPDVSIVSRGPVLARGRPGQEIAFVPASPDRPWGAFALLGAGANGSVFEHVRFVRGGGALVDRIEYIGMVNVHRVSEATFRHASFEDNVRSDDTFHALHSHVVLERSRFVRANSDALDLDVSTGEILNNRFDQSGGDAIDLMTSRPVVAGNEIFGSGDKGISVGEASFPILFNNLIAECQRGIEIKDGSEPIILNTVVVRNGVGIRADLKNWRYGGGGWGKLINTVIEDNRVDFQLDAWSRLTYADADSAGAVARAAAGADGWPATGAGWAYAAAGFAAPGEQAGLLTSWERTVPLAPLVEARFKDDFGQFSDGWEGTGGVHRLEKREDNLIALVRQRAGTVHKRIDWDLTSPDTRSTLVLELGVRDAVSAVVTLASDRGPVTRALVPNDSASVFRYVALDLPPARYTGLQITLAPRRDLERVQARTGLLELGSARLELHGYRLYQTPADGALPSGPRAISRRTPGPKEPS